MDVKKPSWVKQLLNFTSAATEHIKSGLKRADSDTQGQRADICSTCPSLDKESYRCNTCGCFLKFKIAWDTSKCPKGKW